VKFKVTNKLNYLPENILRSVGYFAIFDRKTQKRSFVRKLSNERYPRFHLYLKEENNEIIFDLHLDQSKTVYSGAKAHNADYDSPEVKQELVRIFQEVKKAIPQEVERKTIESENKNQKEKQSEPNWLVKLFVKNKKS
jgi:hypothetical protein